MHRRGSVQAQTYKNTAAAQPKGVTAFLCKALLSSMCTAAAEAQLHGRLVSSALICLPAVVTNDS